MRFANPQILWLLAVTLTLLIWFLWWAWRKRQQLIAQFVQSRLLAQLIVGVSVRRQKLRLVLLVASVALLLLALARPQFGFVWEEVKQRGLDIIVAIDTSRSMLATDVAPNRLTRAKLAALDLMHVAQSDRLGLIAFAGTAFLQCPLTLDDEAFRQSVNALDAGIIPQGGTALTEAIQTALAAFKESEDNFKILVLFTDGEDHDGGAEEAAQQAAKAGLRVFTIGIGTAEGDQLAVADEQGKTSFVTDEDGQVVKSRLNEALLRKIAQVTQGEYLALRGAKPMELLYQARLAPLPKSEIATRLFQQFYERFQWPLGLAILLLMVELFLPERRPVPRNPSLLKEASPELSKAVAFLLLFILCPRGQASPSAAQRAYEAGRFRDAQQEYQRLLKKRPDDPRLHYNAGAAAYRAGRFDQATNQFGAAVLSSDPELLERAYYNLGNSYYRLGEQAEEPTARSENWEQAVQHYDSALKLKPQDPDAKFNREFVSQRLEELKKQQSQSQPGDKKQDDKDKDKDKDKEKEKNQDQQQKQQQQAGKDQDQKDQQKQQQQAQKDKQRQEQEKKDQPGQAQDKPQPKPEEKKTDQAKADKKSAEQKQAQKKEGADGSGDKPEGEDAAAALAAALGQMTPEQARQLLEAAKSEEKPMIFAVPTDGKRRPRSVKDW